MKNIYKILVTAFVFLGNFLLNAQAPPPPDGLYGPPGGGVGGTNTEGAAAPIDMYVYILAIAAIVFIVLYAKRIHQKQAV